MRGEMCGILGGSHLDIPVNLVCTLTVALLDLYSTLVASHVSPRVASQASHKYLPQRV